jgi:hypothetical protein
MASRDLTLFAANPKVSEAATHYPAIQSICLGKGTPRSMKAPLMPGPSAVESTIAETMIAQMPPRLANP